MRIMKKNWFLLSLCLLSAMRLHALPLGNPAEPRIFTCGIFLDGGDWERFSFIPHFLDIRAGYYGDFVYNRKLKVDGPGVSSIARNMIKSEINTNAGYLALNFCERADIFATLGATKITVEANEGAWLSTGGGSTGIIQADDTFSWSVGGRVLLFTLGCWQAGFEGQYFSTRPQLREYYVQSDFGNIVYLSDAPTHYHEWQIGTGISYLINFCCADLSLIPYVGIKWSQCKFNTRNFNFLDRRALRFTIVNTKSRRLWGFPIGLSLVFKRSVELNVETRWGDERALSLKGQFQF